MVNSLRDQFLRGTPTYPGGSPNPQGRNGSPSGGRPTLNIPGVSGQQPAYEPGRANPFGSGMNNVGLNGRPGNLPGSGGGPNFTPTPFFDPQIESTIAGIVGQRGRAEAEAQGNINSLTGRLNRLLEALQRGRQQSMQQHEVGMADRGLVHSGINLEGRGNIDEQYSRQVDSTQGEITGEQQGILGQLEAFLGQLAAQEAAAEVARQAAAAEHAEQEAAAAAAAQVAPTPDPTQVGGTVTPDASGNLTPSNPLAGFTPGQGSSPSPSPSPAPTPAPPTSGFNPPPQASLQPSTPPTPYQRPGSSSPAPAPQPAQRPQPYSRPGGNSQPTPPPMNRPTPAPQPARPNTPYRPPSRPSQPTTPYRRPGSSSGPQTRPSSANTGTGRGGLIDRMRQQTAQNRLNSRGSTTPFRRR